MQMANLPPATSGILPHEIQLPRLGMLLVLAALIVSPTALSVAANDVDSGDYVLIPDAVSRGAVCLDGSPGAYSFEAGSGAGSNSWLIYLYGGAWCQDTEDCLGRTRDRYGSTGKLKKLPPVSGILGTDPLHNPDFHNWNLVRIWYCDGGSFSGDIEELDPSTNLHFRGARIFSAVVEDMLEKGLKTADNAILTGCSAGALATIINCNKFRSMIPLSSTVVKCVADAGFFVNTKNLSGNPFVETYLDSVVNVNGILKNLDPACREEMRRMRKKESLCIFPENLAPHIKTPIFFVNAQYDFYEIRYLLVPFPSPPGGRWNSCRSDITQCSSEQLVRIQLYRLEFLSAFYKGAGISPSRGYFVNGCFDHCQAGTDGQWLSDNSPTIKGTSIAKAVGDWYFERKPFKEIGVPYPLDHTCHNMIG